jgi:hypothetical protein
MELVDKEYARAAEVGRCLREVFANLLRMSRSPNGGEPHSLACQMVEFLEELKRHQHRTGSLLHPLFLQEMVRFYRYNEESCDLNEFDHAFETILEGAAQVIASRIRKRDVGPTIQERLGRDQIMQGVEQISQRSKGAAALR